MKTTARDWIDPTRLYNPSVPAGRLMYVWGSIVYPIALFIAASLILGLLYGSGIESGLAEGLFGAFYIGYIVAGLLIAIRRLRDLGKSGWYLLWGLVPLANIILGLWLLFAPGVARETPRPEPLTPRPPEVTFEPPKVKMLPDGSCPKCQAKVPEVAKSCPWCGTQFSYT